jgi:hypothetical protein
MHALYILHGFGSCVNIAMFRVPVKNLQGTQQYISADGREFFSLPIQCKRIMKLHMEMGGQIEGGQFF